MVSRSRYGNGHRPHDLSCGDFQLCGDRDFLEPFHARHTPSGELSGTQAGQNGELERVEIRGTLHHMRLPFLRTAPRAGLTLLLSGPLGDRLRDRVRLPHDAWTFVTKPLLARDRPRCYVRADGTSSALALEFRDDSASPLAALDKIGVWHNDVRQSGSACTFHGRVRSLAEVGLSPRTQEHWGHYSNAGGLSAVYDIHYT